MNLSQEVLARTAEEAVRLTLTPVVLARIAEQAAKRTTEQLLLAIRSGEFAPSQWMNAKQCAAYMGISHHHLAKLREQRRGPPHRKHGKACVYERGEVDAYLHALPRR